MFRRCLHCSALRLHGWAERPQTRLGAAPSNKGMKLTNLSEAPGETEAPPRAFRRFAAVRTGSQLIPGVGRAEDGVAGWRFGEIGRLCGVEGGGECHRNA